MVVGIDSNISTCKNVDKLSTLVFYHRLEYRLRVLPGVVIRIPVQLMAEIFGVTLELEIFSFPSHVPPLISLQKGQLLSGILRTVC